MKDERVKILEIDDLQRLVAIESKVNINDLDWLTRCIYGEARGEQTAGKIAVAWVVRNRVRRGVRNRGLGRAWGNSYPAVINFPYQFSCFNEGDPNREKLLKLNLSHNRRVVRECLVVALGVLSDWFPDPTRIIRGCNDPRCGADHYLKQKLFIDEKKRPRWSIQSRRDYRFCGSVDKHIFMRLRDEAGFMLKPTH